MWELNVLDEFIGKTLVSVEKSFDSIVFKFSDGSSYMMYHSQDCCESVTVDDIDGFSRVAYFKCRRKNLSSDYSN